MRQSRSQRGSQGVNEAVKESVGYTAAASKDRNLARSNAKGVPSMKAIANKILLKRGRITDDAESS
jgi:hypothetical protein